jgi:nitrite reductase/ring-hydroxylating ferredoxin subunit
MLCCLGPPPPQLDDRGFVVVEAGGRSLLLRRKERQFTAMELICAHQGARLGEEHIGPNLIATCPRHGWQYDLRTGRCKTRPEYLPLPSYEVHLQGGELWVDLPEPRGGA